MRPFDPRLLRYARSARVPIALTALLGTITALLVLAQALLISAALSPIVSGTATLGDVIFFIVGIAAVFACRAVIVAAREAIAARAATEAVTELRGRVIDAAIALGPRWRAMNGAETATLLSTGLEDLRPYFVSFLPQLVLVCTVTPAASAPREIITVCHETGRSTRIAEPSSRSNSSRKKLATLEAQFSVV